MNNKIQAVITELRQIRYKTTFSLYLLIERFEECFLLSGDAQLVKVDAARKELIRIIGLEETAGNTESADLLLDALSIFWGD